MISESLLISRGGTYKEYGSGSTIYKEGGNCTHYHQLLSGRVIWGNSNDQGKEFIQRIIEPGECFGELPLFDNEPYAADAVTCEPSVVIKLPKNDFLDLIREQPDLHFKFSRLLTQRIRYDFFLLKTFALDSPEVIILKVLNHYKSTHYTESKPCLIRLTRQQVAFMTGLRVETVIRAIRSLNAKGELTIRQGKVYL